LEIVAVIGGTAKKKPAAAAKPADELQEQLFPSAQR
jgi:hypothetical protein